jgi:hypothetical protein
MRSRSDLRPEEAVAQRRGRLFDHRLAEELFLVLQARAEDARALVVHVEVAPVEIDGDDPVGRAPEESVNLGADALRVLGDRLLAELQGTDVLRRRVRHAVLDRFEQRSLVHRVEAGVALEHVEDRLVEHTVLDQQLIERERLPGARPRGAVMSLPARRG